MSDTWQKPSKYIPKPGESELPPQLRVEDTSPDAILKSLKELPFFMNDADDIGDDPEANQQLEALRALTYEGEPHEIAMNFKTHGNDCYKEKKYHDAIQYYNQALDQKCNVQEINVASLVNRAACNLELKNYRRCINDCKSALELDPKNMKAIYRSAKAYLMVDRLDECLSVLEYGLALEHDNLALQSLLKQQNEKRAKKEELKRKRELVVQEAETKTRNLQMALQSKHVVRKFSIGNQESGDNPQGKVFLEDPMLPSSALYFTVLFLYPLELESDMFQSVHEDSTLDDSITQLFSSPPPWFAKSEMHPKDYRKVNLEAYVQTLSGGLAKVGKKFSIAKITSMESPKIPLIDDTLRVYIVPKNRASEWLGTWNKEQARLLLKDDD